MKVKAVIHPAAEGGYWAEVPALPGCITEGDTIEEVINKTAKMRLKAGLRLLRTVR